MSWPTKKLGEVAEVGAGNSAPQEKKYFLNGTTPFFRTSDVGKVHLSNDLSTAEDYLNEEAVRNLRIKIYPKHTILFPKSGASTFLNHRVMIGREGAVSSHLATIVAKENALQSFLFYFLLRIDTRKLTADQNYPSLRVTDIQNIKLPLPPLEIQTQIVERLDKIAEAQKLNDELIQKADELFQSLLHKELDPADKDWGIKKLGDVCEITRGGSPRPINQYLTKSPDGINWIKIGDVKEEEKYIISTKEKIKPEGVLKTRLVKEGDLILSNSMSFGRPYILKISGAIHDGWLLLRIKNQDDLLQDFLYYILGIGYTKAQFEKAASGGVVRNLNSDLVRKVKISLPPLETQKQIVIKLSAVQDYKKQLLAQRSKLKELFDSVLHKSMSREV